VRICERNNSADTKVSEEGGGGIASSAGAETFPLQPMVKTMVRQAVSLPWRSMVEQISMCSPWRTPHQSRWMPKRGCDPMRCPHWSRFAGRTCDPMGKSTLEHSVPEELQPMERTYTGAVREEL